MTIFDSISGNLRANHQKLISDSMDLARELSEFLTLYQNNDNATFYRHTLQKIKLNTLTRLVNDTIDQAEKCNVYMTDWQHLTSHDSAQLIKYRAELSLEVAIIKTSVLGYEASASQKLSS